MTKILLIDSSRTFVDGRTHFRAFNCNEAIRQLNKLEGQIDEIWIDYDLNGGTVNLLSFLSLRAKIGSPYKVARIVVHGPSEAGWQVLSARLGNWGYRVVRGTVRDTLA